MISEFNLSKAEQGIEFIAKALDVPENEVVKILEQGMYMVKEVPLNDKFSYFLEEMRASFNIY